MDIRENETIMLKKNASFIYVNSIGMLIHVYVTTYNLEIMTKEATLKTNMVGPAWDLYALNDWFNGNTKFQTLKCLMQETNTTSEWGLTELIAAQTGGAIYLSVPKWRECQALSDW